MASNDATPVLVGVLALQGAFHEHINHLCRVPNVRAIPVRTPEQLAGCDALVIPGGESTAIALGAQRAELLLPMRQWVREGKPVWGTCAGMIMLAREATGGKKQQELIGGWDGRVSRNGWGSQVDSFETPLDITVLGSLCSSSSSGTLTASSPSPSSSSSSSSNAVVPFPGVFIRAPVVERLLPPEELAQAAPNEPAPAGRRQGEELSGVTLVRQGDSKTNPSTPSVEKEDDIPALPLPNLASYGSSETLPPSALRLAVAPPMSDGSVPRPPIQVVARLAEEVRPSVLPGPDADVVALRQGNVFVTTFHPELTKDGRLHEWWVNDCVRPTKQRR